MAADKNASTTNSLRGVGGGQTPDAEATREPCASTPASEGEEDGDYLAAVLKRRGGSKEELERESVYVNHPNFSISTPEDYRFLKQEYMIIDYPEPWTTEMRAAFAKGSGYDLDAPATKNSSATVGITGRPLAPDAPEKKFTMMRLVESDHDQEVLAFAPDDGEEFVVVERAFGHANIRLDEGWCSVCHRDGNSENLGRWYKHDESLKDHFF